MSAAHAGDPLTGRSIARVEDDDLLRGRAGFVDDMEPPGLLHMAFHRTERPHARVLSIDVAAAVAVSGIVAVLTYSDLGQHRELTPEIKRADGYSPPRPLLATEKGRFVGEALALPLAA